MTDREDVDDDREDLDGHREQRPPAPETPDDEAATPAASAAELVCPRCGTVQPRSVACGTCGTPLGQYAAGRRSRLDEVRAGLDELRDRGLLLPIVGVGAALAVLALILIIAVSGPKAPPPGVIPGHLPAAGSDGAPLPAAPADPDRVRPEDLEALIDPRADALLDAAAPPANEAPYAAVIRIKSGVTGELHTAARYDKALGKKRRAVVYAALSKGWTLYLSGPQVARLAPGQARSLKPGRYELAAERRGADAAEAQPRFVLLGLKPGYRYTVSDQPVKKRGRKGKR